MCVFKEPCIQPSVPAPFLVFPRDTGEDTDGGLNGLNCLNGLNETSVKVGYIWEGMTRNSGGALVTG